MPKTLAKTIKLAMSNIYNIRAYAIFIQNNKVLLTDEYRVGMFMTKFPGGGLEAEEGLIECVLRECKEEMNIEVKVKQHFYTTDFFIKSAFGKKEQLLSVYFLMEHQNEFGISFVETKNQIPNVDGAQSFRWVDLNDFSDDDVTFPIDKIVAKKIKDIYAN